MNKEQNYNMRERGLTVAVEISKFWKLSVGWRIFGHTDSCTNTHTLKIIGIYNVWKTCQCLWGEKKKSGSGSCYQYKRYL